MNAIFKSISILLLSALILPVASQNNRTDYFVQLAGITSHGEHAPFWLTARRQGLLSVENNNGYARLGAVSSGVFSRNSDFSYTVMVDLTAQYNSHSSFFVHQAFAEIDWRWLRLGIGSKERFSETRGDAGLFNGTAFASNAVNSRMPSLWLHNLTDLSSGSLTYSGNSRPIPQIRIEIPEYVDFPWTNGWLQVRAHIAYGRFTDDDFQEEYTRKMPKSHYGRNILYHSKAGFIKIGKPSAFPLVFEGGLEMCTQFGGDIYNHEQGKIVSMPSSPMDYWKAFIPLSGSDDTPDVEQTNISGNQLGSWHAAFTLHTKNADIRLYGEHLFEDFSQLFFIEYQNDRNGKKNIIYYPWKDILVGLRITNKSGMLPFLSAMQYEYLYTRNQSGALYHDPSNYFNEQMDGADNYYNHGIYPGWHHWGMGIGNPLIISPAYNGDGNLQFRSNRLVAHNIGINGVVGARIPLAYRLQCTYSENWGTYANPFTRKKYTTSLLGELAYAPDGRKWMCTLSVGYDNSNHIGNNTGIMITLTRIGSLKNK